MSNHLTGEFQQRDKESSSCDFWRPDKRVLVIKYLFPHVVSYNIYLFFITLCHLKSNFMWLYCIDVTKIILELSIINVKCTV